MPFMELTFEVCFGLVCFFVFLRVLRLNTKLQNFFEVKIENVYEVINY